MIKSKSGQHTSRTKNFQNTYISTVLEDKKITKSNSP